MRAERKCRLALWAAGWMLAVMLWLPTMGWAADGTGELVIFHTNDLHARVMPGDDNGTSIGLAEISAAVRTVKSQNPDTLWFDAGDTLHGMPRINISNGENMVKLLNKAGLDLLVPGNHDFNYGAEQLEKLAGKLKCPVMSANILRKGNAAEYLFPPCKVFKLPNNIRVGVFGLTTPETAYKSDPRRVGSVQFLDPVEAARDMVAKLRPKCDVVIAVMHMGLDGSSEFTSERIAKEAPGIDLIVDGHSHTVLTEGIRVGDALIVQTGCHGHSLGRVDISLREHKIQEKRAKLLAAEDVARISPKPDAGVDKALKRIEKENKKFFDRVVAHSDRSLSGDRLLVRRHESELGNLSADAFRWRTGADIGVINGGNIRRDLPEGDVTSGDCLEIFPFGNTLQVAEVTGSTVRSMLEHSVSGYPESFGGFLAVSGMTFQFDPAKPVGMRVSNVYVNGEPLEESRTYRLATGDFILAGGDDYVMLKDSPIVSEFETCEQVLADYLNQVGMKGFETGRIRVLDAEEEDVYDAAA